MDERRRQPAAHPRDRVALRRDPGDGSQAPRLWRRVQLRPIADVAVPVARAGFALAAVSGIGLLATNATEYDGNPFILIKFPAIAIGLAYALLLARSAAWKAARDGMLTADQARRLGVMGGELLASWLTAVTAGRMIGYW